MSIRPGISVGIVTTLLLAGGVGALGAVTHQRAVKTAAELYHTGNTLFDTHQDAQAENLYSALLERRTGAPYRVEVHYKMAQLLERGERYGEAEAFWAKVAQEPGDVAAEEVAYHRGVCAARLGDAEGARGYFTAVRQARPNPFGAPAALALGQLAEAGGDEAGAAAYYETAVQEAASRDTILAAGRALRDMNFRALRRRLGDGEAQTVHLVRAGDTLERIATRYGSTVDLIMDVNGVSDPSRLRVGQRLIVPQTEFAIVINKAQFTLTLYDGDRIFGVYPVGLGVNGCTPVGAFEISEKIKEPTWWSPDGPVAPGAPDNELGSRWMGMRALEPGIGEGYGIHATIRPETIGQEASNGCPRMYEEDAQELFRLIRSGTPVRVDAA